MNINDLYDILKNYKSKEIIFVGLGNELKGDDTAGLIFLEQLKISLQFSKATFIKAGTNPENYLDKILELNAKAVVFIDAVRLGESPGSIKILSPEEIDTLSISTHTFSIRMIEYFLKQNQDLDVFYIGIQPQSMYFFEDISENVMKGINAFFFDN